MDNWYIYVIVIGAVIAIYFISALVVFLLMKKAQKKAFDALDKLIPVEQERLAVITSCQQSLIGDDRHLSKNMTDLTSQTEELFQSEPIDLQKAKGQIDFLIIYYRKYLKEKRLVNQPKYQDYDTQMEHISYFDPEDKNSPYYSYNKLAIRYNSYLSMAFLNPFRGKAQRAPTL